MRPELDAGREFDWGRASADYARWRDLYPESYYRRIADLGIGAAGQQVLDLGTGTGVLPRHMHRLGARWTGVDSSAAQIQQARRLSAGADITYLTGAAEEVPLGEAVFDAVTAAQCFFYFDHERLEPRLHAALRPGGRILITYLAWLPQEDPLAAASEELVLRHNPDWSGGGEVFRPAEVPVAYAGRFRLVHHTEERLDLPFTRESWHGRMCACRGTGASMDEVQLSAWERDHKAMLARLVPTAFTVKHCLAVALLERG